MVCQHRLKRVQPKRRELRQAPHRLAEVLRKSQGALPLAILQAPMLVWSLSSSCSQSWEPWYEVPEAVVLVIMLCAEYLLAVTGSPELSRESL